MQISPNLMEKWVIEGFPIKGHLLKGISFGVKLLYDNYKN